MSFRVIWQSKTKINWLDVQQIVSLDHGLDFPKNVQAEFHMDVLQYSKRDPALTSTFSSSFELSLVVTKW